MLVQVNWIVILSLLTSSPCQGFLIDAHSRPRSLIAKNTEIASLLEDVVVLRTAALTLLSIEFSSSTNEKDILCVQKKGLTKETKGKKIWETPNDDISIKSL